MSTISYFVLLFLQLGMLLGPLLIVVEFFRALFGDRAARSKHIKGFTSGLAVTAVGWIALDVEMSIECKDWRSQGFGNEQSCKSVKLDDRWRSGG